MASYINSPKPLYAVGCELDHRVIGYQREKLLVFCLAMSYKLKHPANVILVGPSSAGKSYIFNNVMKHFPVTSNVKEAMKNGCGLSLTGISAKVLNRFEPPGGTWNNKLLCVQELDGASEAGPVIRTFMSEGMSSTIVTEKTEDGMKVKTYNVTGTPAFFVTTANDSIEQQFANRCNVIEVGGDNVREVLGYEGGRYEADEFSVSADDQLRTEIESLPNEKHVMIPYARKLSSFWYSDTVVAQRSFPEFCKLIQCITILHQKQRKRSNGLLVSNIDDYIIAARISKISKFKLGSGLLRAYKKIVEAIRHGGPEFEHPLASALADGSSAVRGVTREQLAGLIERSLPQIERYLEELCNHGIMRTHMRWMKNEQGKGERNPNVYSLALATEEDIVFPSPKRLLDIEGKDFSKLKFVRNGDKWGLVEGKTGIPVTVHAYDPLTGADIDVGKAQDIFMLEKPAGKEMKVRS